MLFWDICLSFDSSNCSFRIINKVFYHGPEFFLARAAAFPTSLQRSSLARAYKMWPWRSMMRAFRLQIWLQCQGSMFPWSFSPGAALARLKFPEPLVACGAIWCCFLWTGLVAVSKSWNTRRTLPAEMGRSVYADLFDGCHFASNNFLAQHVAGARHYSAKV